MSNDKRECPQKNNCIAKDDGCYEDMDICFWRDDIWPKPKTEDSEESSA